MKSRASRALVRPHLEYSAPVWSPPTSEQLDGLKQNGTELITAGTNRTTIAENRYPGYPLEDRRRCQEPPRELNRTTKHSFVNKQELTTFLLTAAFYGT